MENEIAIIRKKTGMTQAAFCARYHIPPRTLQDWEQGKHEPPVYVVELLRQVVKMQKDEMKNETTSKKCEE